MSELALTRDERLELRARAHHLNPVVLLGNAGLSEAIFKETDRALNAHELIKVRIPGDDRDEREAIGAQLADRLGAARVQAIGKLLVLYRPRPEKEEAPTPARARQRAPSRAGPGTAGARTTPGRAAKPETRARRGR